MPEFGSFLLIGAVAALVTFVVKGLSEVYDPRGGYPIGKAARIRSIRQPMYEPCDMFSHHITRL